MSRDQPHLLDGLAAPAKELDSTGSAAALAGARLIAVNNKQADFTDGALGNGHGWGGAENTDQTPRRRPLARGEHREPCGALASGNQRGMLRRGVRAAPPASSQWQRCKCRADSSPRQASIGAGSPGIEDQRGCSRQDRCGCR